MRATVSVRQLEVHEWPTFRDLRLRALADAPDSFASTLVEEQQLSDADWARRLSSAIESTAQITAVAEIGRRAVGLVYGRLETSAPDIAHLYSMWVEPAARQSGVGCALVKRVISWARTANAERLVLQVSQGNSSAMNLYKQVGFACTQELSPLRPGSPLLVQTMELKL